MPTIYLQVVILNGGHAEPVIGRAFARPVGFAHPTSATYFVSTGNGLTLSLGASACIVISVIDTRS